MSLNMASAFGGRVTVTMQMRKYIRCKSGRYDISNLSRSDHVQNFGLTADMNIDKHPFNNNDSLNAFAKVSPVGFIPTPFVFPLFPLSRARGFGHSTST